MPFQGQLRHAKRFTGTRWEANYTTILQQYDGEKWIDVTPENSVWETPQDEHKYAKAKEMEYRGMR